MPGPGPWTEVAKAHISPLDLAHWAAKRPADARQCLGAGPSYERDRAQLATGPREESGGSSAAARDDAGRRRGGGGTLGVTRTGGSDASTARPSSGKGQWQSYKFGLQHVAGSFLGWSVFLVWSRSLLIDANTRLNSLFARDTTYFLRPADIFAARVSEGSASVSWMKPTYPEIGSALSRRIHGRVGCFGNG